MPLKNLLPLEQGKYYHIYNRGNGSCNLFYKDDNYRYFLSKYDYYLSPYLDTFAYCLMPNHFHMLVRVKDFPSDSQAKKKNLERQSPTIVSEQFRKFYMSYSKAINKQEKRSGSLFQKNFRRREIRSDAYFAKMIFYIHNNPVHHKFTDDVSLYRWSSYHALVKDQPTKLNKLELLQWFGGKNDFIEFHKNASRGTDFPSLGLSDSKSPEDLMSLKRKNLESLKSKSPMR